MRASHRLRRLSAVYSLSAMTAVLAGMPNAVYGGQFNVDFGIDTYKTDTQDFGIWNNVSGVAYTRPIVTMQLVDSTGTASSIDLSTQFSDPNSNTAGVSDPVQNYEGPYPWVFPPYPISALEDGWYVKGGQQLTITLQSLNPHATYIFDFYSGTKCCLGSTTYFVVGANSSGGTIPESNIHMTLYGIFPDSSNRIRIFVTGGYAYGSGYSGGQINLMSFVEDTWRVFGDYNFDYLVNAEDYNVWRTSFSSDNLDADGNGDGIVDAADYVIWRFSSSNPGSSGSGASEERLAIPEPSCVGLLLVAAASILTMFRRFVALVFRNPNIWAVK